MTRGALWSIGIAAVAVLLWLSATAYVGGAVRDQYAGYLQDQAEELKRLSIEVREGPYERGFFESKAEVVYANADDGRTLCRLRHDIKHGPLLFAESFLGLAAIDSRLIIPEELRSEHLDMQAGKAPLTAKSIMSLDGSFTSRLSAPEAAWKTSEGEVAWSGLKGRIDSLQGRNNRLEMQANLAELIVRDQGKKESMVLRDVGLKGRTVQDEQGQEGQQSMTVSIAKAEHVREKSSESTMESISLTGEGSWSDGLMNSTTRFRFNSLESGNMRLRQGILDIRAENINRTALQELQDLPVDTKQGESPGKALEPAAINRLVRQLLQTSPAVEIARLQFQTGNGTVQLQARAAYEHSGNVPLGDRVALLRKIQAEADVQAPKDFTVRAVSLPISLSRAFQQKRNQGQEGRLKQGSASQQARRWLRTLGALGFIEEKQARYSTRAGLDNGILSVNGVKILDLARMQ